MHGNPRRQANGPDKKNCSKSFLQSFPLPLPFRHLGPYGILGRPLNGQDRGGIRLTEPDHGLCRVIFVFAGKPLLPYTMSNKGPKKAKPIEQCQESDIWSFFDLCTHFGRPDGDKIKNKQFVVDYTWVQHCIDQGTSDQSSGWQGMEVM